VNLEGEVVGIRTKMGFAIPIDSALDSLGSVVKELVAKNKAENLAKKAEKAEDENARVKWSRVAAEDAAKAQAAAMSKMEQEIAQLKADLYVAVCYVRELEAARQERERKEKSEAAEMRRVDAAAPKSKMKQDFVYLKTQLYAAAYTVRKTERAATKSAENGLAANAAAQAVGRDLAPAWPAQTVKGRDCKGCLNLGKGTLCFPHR